MNPKAPSLTAYDFLGYIVPGLGILLLVDVSVFYHFSGADFSYESICKRYTDIKIAGVIPLLLLSYLVGHVIGFCSAVLIERHSTWLHGNPTSFLLWDVSPESYFTTGGVSPKFSKVFRTLTAVMILPISAVDFLFAYVIPLSKNYMRPLDSLLVRASGAATRRIFDNLGIDLIEREDEIESLDIHRLTIHCAIESAPNHVASLRNYVVLYGFLRSVALILVCVFWVLIFHLNGRYVWWHVLLWTGLVAIFSYIVYAAFVKFRIRYHREGIMAVIASRANLAS